MATGRIGTTPVLTTRWSKSPSAGTTSLSGLDDNSVSLVYSVGYEAVYQNGVLLSRGNDYTATNGTTITLTTATVAGDIIEVFANQTIPLTDTYSQTVSDGRFIKNTLTTTTGDIIYASAANTPARLGIGSAGQVLTVSSGVPAWGTASSGLTLITSGSFSNVASITIDNCFTTTYRRYMVLLSETYAATAADDTLMQLRYSSTTKNSSYYGGGFQVGRQANSLAYGTVNSSSFTISQNSGSNTATASSYTIWFDLVGQTSASSKFYGQGFNNGDATYSQASVYFAGMQDDQNTYTGLVFSSSSSNITGRYAVYGLAN